jgi:hypothetical protein
MRIHDKKAGFVVKMPFRGANFWMTAFSCFAEGGLCLSPP